MKRRLLFALALALIILVIVMNYKIKYSPALNTAVDSALTIRKAVIPITYEEDIPSERLTEIQKGVSYLPMDLIDTFVAEGWHIAAVKEIKNDNDIFPFSAIGETDFGTKTITIQIEELLPQSITDVVALRTVHEMCHYADKYYGSITDTTDWQEIYTKNKEGYIEYEYSGIKATDATDKAINYASSDKYELFACSMKDYFIHPDYVKQRYPEVFEFYTQLEKDRGAFS